MTETETPANASARGVDRRSLLTGGAVGLGLGGLLGVGGALGFGALRAPAQPAPHPVSAAEAGTEPSLGVGGELPGFGGESLPCHGTHQAGIITPAAAHMRLVAYQLHPEVDRDGIGRMLRILTGDVEGLASGEGPLADPEPELAARPSRLTVTVGVGPELVNRIDPLQRPEWLAPLPAFSRDKLGNGYDGGDLLLMVQADDPLPVAHAARMLHRDLKGFAELLWIQEGFRHARGSEEDGRTMRNMMGQIDGTINPSPADDTFDSLVWLGPEAGALEGGSAYVIRRIRLELDTWDRVDRPGRESTIGRRLSDGSPLSAPEGESDEFTPVDFEAKDSIGFPIIPSTAHIRRAHATNEKEHIFRRAANYEHNGESGLLFGCFQRDPREQFTPIQQRLDELDMLNEWVTHVGSAVFAMLPGFEPNGWLGEELFG